MSVKEKLGAEPQCDDIDCEYIEKIIKGREKDLGAIKVKRVLPSAKIKTVGPWIFFDHMGPAHLSSESRFDVKPHPHINLATVTYLFEGEILHRDSLGSIQTIEPGAVNLMVAGRGITHSERESVERISQQRSVHGLQLWLALPEEFEEIEPEFHHYSKGQLPSFTTDGVAARVLMGSAHGCTSPVKTFSETLYVQYDLKKGASVEIPESSERAIYVVEGKLRIGESIIHEGNMAVLNASKLEVYAEADTVCSLVGGEPMPKRFIFWNFISSRKDRIEQAKEDWRNNRFETIPGDDKEFFPLPGE